MALTTGAGYTGEQGWSTMALTTGAGDRDWSTLVEPGSPVYPVSVVGAIVDQPGSPVYPVFMFGTEIQTGQQWPRRQVLEIQAGLICGGFY